MNALTYRAILVWRAARHSILHSRRAARGAMHLIILAALLTLLLAAGGR